MANLQRLEVTRVGELGVAGQAATAAAQVARDGRTLFLAGGDEIMAVDSYSFEPKTRWPVGGTVGSLGLSPDGSRLYAGLKSEVAILSAASGERLGSLPVPGLESIQHVGRRTSRQ